MFTVAGAFQKFVHASSLVSNSMQALVALQRPQTPPVHASLQYALHVVAFGLRCTLSIRLGLCHSFRLVI